MYRYKQIEYRAGATVEIIKCIPRGCRKGLRKGPKKTKEEIRQGNMQQAVRRLARKLNANFRPGDLHVILTYRKEERPSAEEAKEILRKFLDRLRRKYRRQGRELKYIHVTEYKRTAIHHHLIVNNLNDGKETTMDYIRKLWSGRGSPKYVQLYETGEYQQLAEYLIKETEKTFRDAPEKQRYGCSRNLIEPKAERRIRKTKNGWQKDPRPREGYYILPDSLYNGFDRLGYPYQRYVLVKIRPSEADWNPFADHPVTIRD